MILDYSFRSQSGCSTLNLGKPKKIGQPIRSTHKKVNPRVNPFGQPIKRSTRGSTQKKVNPGVNPKKGQPILSINKKVNPSVNQGINPI